MLGSSQIPFPELFPILTPLAVVRSGTVINAASFLSFFPIKSDPEIIFPH